MSASADVLAQAKVEIDLANIPEGKNVRDKPSPARRARVLTHATRSSSSGEASPFSSATAPRTRSRKPSKQSGRPCEIPNQTQTVSRSPSG